MANFSALAPHLATAGIDLKPTDVRAIITEQRSVAAKVLYQLREYADAAAKARAPRKSGGGDPAEAGTGWVRDSVDSTVSDPARRAEIEFIRKALIKGACAWGPQLPLLLCGVTVLAVAAGCFAAVAIAVVAVCVVLLLLLLTC